jgi:sigma-E factor negative regulatory protein RseC
MANQNSSRIINHDGIVRKIGADCVEVTIISSSACSGCHAEGSCIMSGKEEKKIEVRGKYDVKPGDKVTVLMKQSMGYTALLLGYVFPIIVVVASLSALITYKVPELSAGLISVVILMPYYVILYLFRKTINKKFTFTLKV